MTPWWTGAAAVSSGELEGCGHEITWREGELLTAADVDIEGEHVLRSLGGAGCRCVEAHQAWHALAGDLEVLQLGPRHEDDRIQPPARQPYDVFPPSVEAYRRLIDILPDPVFQRRLVATVAAAWATRPASADEHARLVVAMHGRLWWTLRRWLDPDVRLRTTLHGDPDHALHLDRAGHDVAATVGIGWLAHVWGRDLVIVDDALVVSVDVRSSSILGVAMVDRALEARRLDLVLTADGWSVPIDDR
jgi:hypothetical protein